ncbi:MAG TPA: hypothetical protein VGB55_00280 [Tepidisphaeraceae bacterium]|jgi:hypothetical protein
MTKSNFRLGNGSRRSRFGVVLRKFFVGVAQTHRSERNRGVLEDAHLFFIERRSRVKTKKQKLRAAVGAVYGALGTVSFSAIQWPPRQLRQTAKM